MSPVVDHPRFSSLDDWLRYQESLHPAEIELGLDRVRAVWQRLHAGPPPFFTITVAGTNGKGSSVAMLEAVLRAAGHATGAYTSPHLLRYNERIRLGGEPVGDAELVAAFARVDAARGEVPLTYFEFGTLAALDIFWRQAPAVALLEVGLGGRLDAVNILDPDIALITGIGLDHTDWLGPDREAIGAEKAGILRPARPAVFAGDDMPASIAARAADLGVPLAVAGRDYACRCDASGLIWQGREGARRHPLPALPGRHQCANAGGVLAVLEHLPPALRPAAEAIDRGLRAVRLPGRFTRRPGRPEWILDVAHNPDGMRALAALLKRPPGAGRTLAIVGMLRDKAVAEAMQALSPRVDHWLACSPGGPRALPAAELAQVLGGLDRGAPVETCADVAVAVARARELAGPDDRVLICGSFLTVAGAMAAGV